MPDCPTSAVIALREQSSVRPGQTYDDGQVELEEKNRKVVDCCLRP